MNSEKIEETNTNEVIQEENDNGKKFNISREVNFSNEILETKIDDESNKKTDSIMANRNLKFITSIPKKKNQKQFKSEFHHIQKNDFGITNYSLFKDKPHSYLENTFEKSLMDKSEEWKGFKDTYDNLEVIIYFYIF